MPVRVGQPDKLTGIVDKLQSPAFSTSVGLLKWAVLMNEVSPASLPPNGHSEKSLDWDGIKDIVKRFLP
jgi:cell division protein FtsA